jgi:hypothetical protein
MRPLASHRKKFGCWLLRGQIAGGNGMKNSGAISSADYIEAGGSGIGRGGQMRKEGMYSPRSIYKLWYSTSTYYCGPRGVSHFNRNKLVRLFEGLSIDKSNRSTNQTMVLSQQFQGTHYSPHVLTLKVSFFSFLDFHNRNL